MTLDVDDPQLIGPYRVEDRIGEGGMGVVYLAEQTAPVKRRVAIKLIKLGMDTKEVLTRFDGERQALALMDHPSIARIFDASATEQGRPYFVMEYVPGSTICDYCDEHRLDTKSRLRLFVRACRAIQHAHTKGIIHRDIKPTNVLVSEVDGTPTPKVIDFGVAKAMDRGLTEATLLTEVGHTLGTPEYMSPEQADPGSAGIDTRSDVYSLGVVLYELLIGLLPLELPKASGPGLFHDFQRLLLHIDPAPPSTRLTRLGERATTNSERRDASPRELARRLRGELDWITMKALTKEPDRRYQSAAELADDIERHLDGLPVLASPPSTTYRLRKLVLRNRIAVGFAATVVILLGALAVTSTVQNRHIAEEARRANRERDRANETAGLARQERDRANEAAAQASLESERASRAAEQARVEARLSAQVTQFLVDLFGLAQPGEEETITAREMLHRGAEQVQNALAEQPVVLSVLCNKIGTVYKNLGLYAEAEPLLVKAVELLEDRGEAEISKLAPHLTDLGILYSTLGRYEPARDLLQRGLEAFENAPEEDPLGVSMALNALGTLAVHEARYTEAVELHERALELELGARGPDDFDLELSYNNLAAAQYYAGKHVEAAENFRQSLRLHESLDRQDPNVVYIYNNVANLNLALGKKQEAERDLRRALELCDRYFEPVHEVTGAVCEMLASLCLDQTPMPAETEELVRRGLTIRESIYGDQNLVHGRTLALLGRLLVRQGDHQAARAPVERALATLNQHYAPDEPRVSAARCDLIELDLLAGRPLEEHLESLGEILEFQERDGDLDRVARTLELQARLFEATGWETDAALARERALELRAAVPDAPGRSGVADR